MSANYYYIFSHFVNDIPVFERSIPIGCEYRLEQRLKELNDLHGYSEAFYTTELPKKYWY